MSEANSESIELNQQRIIALKERGRHYWMHCRRITQQDWTRYFSGIVVTSQQDGKERINVVDVTTPRLALAEAVLSAAYGYKVEGHAEIMELPNWQERIPLSHRLQLGEVLADVRPTQTDTELVIYPEGEVVFLDATWSAHSADATRVERFVGLKHVLKTPSEEQHRRYSREASRSRVVGGSRSGKTVYQGAQSLLARLYDELVVSVEGYTVDGSPLTTSEQIVREMDMLHKVMAAQELFQPQNTAALADGEGE